MIQINGCSAAPEREARADVRSVDAQSAESIIDNREIQPETALAIASWWQSSGTVGSVLAGFASGAAVERRALLDDITRTRATAGYIAPHDQIALDCLCTFVIHYGGQ